jgi:Glycosyl transferase family 2
MSCRCTYLLPIRRSAFVEADAEELAEYFASLQAAGCEVIVVDGSPKDTFNHHHDRWLNVCRHEPVDPRFGYLNDKVNGIHTGVALAASEKIILADDDIRHSPADIEQMCALLDRFEVVRPQNYFTGMHVAERNAWWIGRSAGDVNTAAQPPDITRIPLWAKMEAARMLINRATLRHADYPGTCAFRKISMLEVGEYDGDVLFDNEEMIRHFARRNARTCYANNFFIAKRPPKLRKWFEQRPRQAYEDFGVRFKTILFASFLPLAIWITLIAGIKWLSIFALSMLVALAGWLRGSARKYFPLHTCLFAPLWIAERTLSTYWAFYWFLTRGAYPFGDRMLKKGIGRDWFEGGRRAGDVVTGSRFHL